MTNGIDHNQGQGHDPKKPPRQEKADTPPAPAKPQPSKSGQKAAKN